MIRRRKPIDRSTTPLKRTELKRSHRRIPSRSERVLAKLPKRAQVVDTAWDRDGGHCRAERLVPHVRCGGKLDMHERIPRSAWPGGELVIDNVMVICRRHHEWVGDHPEEAHAVGLHGYSWERP